MRAIFIVALFTFAAARFHRPGYVRTSQPTSPLPPTPMFDDKGLRLAKTPDSAIEYNKHSQRPVYSMKGVHIPLNVRLEEAAIIEQMRLADALRVERAFRQSARWFTNFTRVDSN